MLVIRVTVIIKTFQSMKMDVADLDKYCPRGLNLQTVTTAEYQSAAFNDTCLEVTRPLNG